MQIYMQRICKSSKNHQQFATTSTWKWQWFPTLLNKFNILSSLPVALKYTKYLENRVIEGHISLSDQIKI